MSKPIKHVYEFGPFRLDDTEHCLLRDGEPIPLKLKAFETLRALVQSHGHVLAKAELMKTIWPDTIVEENNLEQSISLLRKTLGARQNEPKYIETIPRRGYRFVASVKEGWEDPVDPATVRSLAVLPLENLSGDLAPEHFADGMTDALITDLAKIGVLRVISRTSVMRYRGTREPLPEIAQKLHVDAVVEGSVQRSADRVRINVQLIHAATERHLWTETYERDQSDVLVLQSEVARAIAREIKIKLTPQEEVCLASTRPVHREAYEAYLKGLYHWNKQAPQGVQKALEYFQQAIEKDPGYALAYARLADCHNRLGTFELRSPQESFAKATAAAMKALELDEKLAEAHTALAFARLYYDWDWPGAEREYRRALELNPGSGEAHEWYSFYLMTMARTEESLAEMKRAHELDPLSLNITTWLGWPFYYARQYDQAIEQFRKALDMEPNYWYAMYCLGLAHTRKGEFSEAITALQKASALSTGSPGLVEAALAYAYAVAGQRGEAEKVLDELNELSKQRGVSPYFMAILYTGLGEKDQAFGWLEKAYEKRVGRLVQLKKEPMFDSLRSDPRFTDLLRRIGLSP